MGLKDVLFGRKKLAEPRDDRLFSLTTAAVTMETELGLKTAGAAAIAFKPQSSGEFRSAFDEVDQLVDAVAAQCGSKIERKTDEYGFDWMIVHDDDLEDLVGAAHTLASELTAKGFGSQLLAAIAAQHDRTDEAEPDDAAATAAHAAGAGSLPALRGGSAGGVFVLSALRIGIE